MIGGARQTPFLPSVIQTEIVSDEGVLLFATRKLETLETPQNLGNRHNLKTVTFLSLNFYRNFDKKFVLSIKFGWLWLQIV